MLIARLDTNAEEFGHRRRKHVLLRHVPEAHPAHDETPDRDGGAIERQRRNDDVDARAVREARIDHRARFVDPASHPTGDPLRDVKQVLPVAEPHVDPFQPAAPLDIHRLHAVDEYVGDLRVEKQRFDGTQPLDVVHELGNHPLPVHRTETRHAGVFGIEECEQLAG